MRSGSHTEGTAYNAMAVVVCQIDGVVKSIERGLVICCMLAIVAAAIVLTYSAVCRHLFDAGNAIQDELAVFLLVGAVFLSAPYVQRNRGHIAMEVGLHLLSARANRARQLAVDSATIAFCIFFARESWALVKLAWLEGHTSNSTWAPPLWIPYSLMAMGMTLLCVRLALQICRGFLGGRAGS